MRGNNITHYCHWSTSTNTAMFSKQQILNMNHSHILMLVCHMLRRVSEGRNYKYKCSEQGSSIVSEWLSLDTGGHWCTGWWYVNSVRICWVLSTTAGLGTGSHPSYLCQAPLVPSCLGFQTKIWSVPQCTTTCALQWVVAVVAVWGAGHLWPGSDWHQWLTGILIHDTWVSWKDLTWAAN